jgi:sugar O-acyltransferase (sialic acid O-acetyltransferase NeuD family)
MSTIIRVPAIAAHENTVLLVGWLKQPAEPVRRGDALCALESSTVNIRLEAASDGFFHPLAGANQRIAVGAPLAVLSDRQDDDPAALVAADRTGASEQRWTKQAAITARRVGLDIEALAQRNPGKLLDEADVLAAQSANQAASAAATAVSPPSPGRPEDLLWDRYPHGRPERILLLGGGAGAGMVALDSLSRIGHQRAVGILDKNPNACGKSVAGVPILGGLDRAEELWRAGFCDSVIILFSDRIAEREALFNHLRAKGVPFANVVDPTAQLRNHVRMGQGNLILGNGFLATCVSVGDNNFILSHSCIEHHATVGSHCVFGPRFTTTGYVKIGDRVRTGMSVSLEPHVKIGDDSVIASGCVLTRDVPARSIIKAHQTYILRPLHANAAE